MFSYFTRQRDSPVPFFSPHFIYEIRNNVYSADVLPSHLSQNTVIEAKLIVILETFIFKMLLLSEISSILSASVESTVQETPVDVYSGVISAAFHSFSQYE